MPWPKPRPLRRAAAVLRHLEAVRNAVIENADAFRSREDADDGAQAGVLARYEVNLVVDVGGSDGAVLIEADLPSYQNLIGRIDTWRISARWSPTSATSRRASCTAPTAAT